MEDLLVKWLERIEAKIDTLAKQKDVDEIEARLASIEKMQNRIVGLVLGAAGAGAGATKLLEWLAA